MASGGHHGGGFHSGGHHSSGGGFHGGGGGHYRGGGYYGGHYSDGDNVDLAAELIVGGIVLIGYTLSKVADNELPGLNLINLTVFVVTGMMYFFIIRDSDRLEPMSQIKAGNLYTSMGRIAHLYHGMQPALTISDKNSWASKFQDYYCIALYDSDFREENARKVYDAYSRTPRIIWVSQYVWMVISIISFFSTFFFYESAIPYFERSVMTDEAFAFIDDFIFYLPSVISLLSAVTCLVLRRIGDNILHKCAVRIVEDNLAAEERLKTEGFINNKLSSKWYYNNCPNCGAEVSRALKSCTFCGSSLEVQSFVSGNSGAVHRISLADEEQDRKVTGKEKI